MRAESAWHLHATGGDAPNLAATAPAEVATALAPATEVATAARSAPVPATPPTEVAPAAAPPVGTPSIGLMVPVR